MMPFRRATDSYRHRNPPVFPHRGVCIGFNWLGASAKLEARTPSFLHEAPLAARRSFVYDL
jgi:hypothetical protein